MPMRTPRPTCSALSGRRHTVRLLNPAPRLDGSGDVALFPQSSTPNPENAAEMTAPDPQTQPPAVAEEPEVFDSDAHRARVEAVRKAVQTWSGQLVDLSARNNLLFYRDLTKGTMSLGETPPTALFDALAGKTVTLSRLFPDAVEHENAVKRARVIHNRAQEHFEERGLKTLYLACGMATWSNQRGTATPSAPVLLCPARLAPRGAAQDEFELSITGDAEVNQTLLQALESDFECHCDPVTLLSRAGIDGALDTPEELDIVFSWLAEQATCVPGFSLSPRFVLATFAYAKLPMVKDLEGSEEAMIRHDLIAALAGDPGAQVALRERIPRVDALSPNYVPPADEFLVLDADASQNYAVNAVLGGQDVVVKGPPGTGKSQTITNLISTLVARGLKVLFVAEKRAAIDAVLKRLDQVRLGDLVLDLHGGASSKRQIAQRLASALSTNSTIAQPSLDAEHRLLTARRDELNAHAAALHHPREPWGISLFDAQAETFELPEAAATHVRFRRAELERLDSAAYEQARENLRTYVGLGGLALADSGSPWAKATIDSTDEGRAAQDAVDALRRALPAITARLRAAAQQTGVRDAEMLIGWQNRLELWAAAADTLACFDEGIFDLPLADCAAALAPLGEGASKRMAAAIGNGEYRAARKDVKAHLRNASAPRKAQLLAAVAAAGERAEEWAKVATADSKPLAPEDLDGLRAAYTQVTEQLAALAVRIGVNAISGSEDEIVELLDRLRGDTRTLALLPELHRLRTAMETFGLGELLADLSVRRLTPEQSLHALRHAWLWSIIDHVRLADPHIGAFNGEQHSRTQVEFQASDRRHIETTSQRVRRAAAERAVTVEEEQAEQGMLIRDQAARKRGHLAIRQLFAGAPDMLTALKPCWAMSPLVVSQLLPADQPYFDVVVFDEASQVRPAEAIPAILRGKRLVVAGDERQLPPTAFFTGGNADGADGAVDESMIGRVVVDAGYESILEALLPYIGQRTLEWHYRSRDERLIAFSNAHLYDWSLTTFPGIHGPETIRHVDVPFQGGQHGNDDSSAAEVQQVVDLIIEHAEQRPDESLGVIAMGIKHADRIEEELRRVLQERDDLEAFFDENRDERFFVKNLERVQGDERDAIILTVGYGKTADGRMQYRFGPLNQEGGERRLNVAVTRAKSRMTVVSSFASADMDPDRCKARGADLLRLYLQYAESRGDKLTRHALETPKLNPFEIDVRDALTRAGIPLCCQVGCSGYRIDFAAKHPTQPGRMVLAIETDGASYHSGRTARDRDRLRQEHLENLGWRFHRIWSQDWFTNRDHEIERAVAAYHAAVAAAADPEVRPPLRRDSRPVDMPTGHQVPERPFPRGLPPEGSPITSYTPSQLRQVVAWVESDTLLRTRDQLLTDIMDALGFKKRGTRIVAAITAAIDSHRGGSRPGFAHAWGD
jgi:very-short-patch-repair endonuclease